MVMPFDHPATRGVAQLIRLIALQGGYKAIGDAVARLKFTINDVIGMRNARLRRSGPSACQSPPASGQTLSDDGRQVADPSRFHGKFYEI